MTKTLDQKIGQLMIAGFRENKISKTSDISKYIRDYNISGVILYDEDMEKGGSFSRNINSPNQLKNLSKSIQNNVDNPIFISIDQEGGKVSRLKEEYGFPSFPSWQEIGKLDDISETKKLAESLANHLNYCGINLNYAPVLDLDYGQKTYIGNAQRALSKNPKKIIEHSSILIKTLKKKNIFSCVKHFPGQGSGLGDTHQGIDDISNTWSKQELIPYETMINSGILDMVMISHVFHRLYDSNLPASLSKNIATELLRKKLHFEGVIICDDPSMKAISNNYSLEDTFTYMINAGIDIFCLGNNLGFDPYYVPKCVQAIKEGINKKKISIEKIEQSILRINKLKDKL
jgi:beta-N-acetylhexosaminidase